MGEKSREAKIKLTADYVNGLGVGFFSIGVITPIAALAFEQVELSIRQITFVSIAFLATSLILHIVARKLLDRLDP